MYWYRAKTILIIFFLCTNLFLLGNILKSANQGAVVSEEIVSAAVTVLEKNGVSVDPALIPRRSKPAAVIKAENIIGDYDAFAETMLSGNVQKGENSTYTGTAGKLSIAGNTFFFTAENPKTTQLSPAQAADAFLKERGLDLSDGERDIEGNTVVYRQEFSGLPFWDGYCRLQVENGAVISAEGRWFFKTNRTLFGEKHTLKNITGILADYAGEANAPSEIQALALGYMLPAADSYTAEVTLIPAWQITDTAGNSVRLDARENNS